MTTFTVPLIVPRNVPVPAARWGHDGFTSSTLYRVAPLEPNPQNEGESNVIGAAEVVAVTAGVEGRERLVQ